MKILCMCRYGHSRSVALARALHEKGHEAVAVGWMTAGNAAIETLSHWADSIAVVDHGGDREIPSTCSRKVSDFDAGPDRWSNPYHPELFSIMRAKVAEKTADVTIR